MQRAKKNPGPTGPGSQHATPATPLNTANLISRRLRYALAKEGYSQRRVLPRINARIERLAPGAPTLSAAGLSRVTTGKRPVKDYELVAIAQALDTNPTWLLGAGDIGDMHTTATM